MWLCISYLGNDHFSYFGCTGGCAYFGARGDIGRSSYIRFVFHTEKLGKFVKIYIFCFILLFTSSLPCDKDQFAVL